MTDFKQAIIVRTDISMSSGKLAVQAAHASVNAVLNSQKTHKKWLNSWIDENQKKVVLKVNDLKSLKKLSNKAKKEHIPFSLIKDSGLTELKPKTVTALGIGPGPEKEIDKITGDLSLFRG